MAVWWSIEANISVLVADPCGPCIAAFVKFNNDWTHCKYGIGFYIHVPVCS